LLVVGNDVVDLRHPDTRQKSRDHRFVRRVLLPEEQEQVYNDPHPDCRLWMFWAVKETAYKIFSKKNPSISSSPLKYKTERLEELFLPGHTSDRRFTCAVTSPGGRAVIIIYAGSDYLHAFAGLGNGETPGSMHIRVFHLGEEYEKKGKTDSVIVRNVLRNYLGRYWHISLSRIAIHREKNERGLGAPRVYINDEKAPVDVSISHHGRYGAFVLFTGER
jgi:hypothetical protein